MVVAEHYPLDLGFLNDEIGRLLLDLGVGKVEGVAYDTAWCGRLHAYYPNLGFDACLEWLRENQYEDGSWGASFVHHHDRFVSTLAAIVALQEAGNDRKDGERIRRGESALWQHVGKLQDDDSDTVGFPIVSAALAEDALALGLDIPLADARFSVEYRKRVSAMIMSTQRDWRTHPLSFSLEALRRTVHDGDTVLEPNGSVGVSPAATAGYLIEHWSERAALYLQQLLESSDLGAIPALCPIDSFEISWAISHLRAAQVIEADSPEVRRALSQLWEGWSQSSGIGYASMLRVHEVDDTAAGFSALQWGNYPVNVDVFRTYETENEFATFPNETNPSVSVNVRVLKALKTIGQHDDRERWIQKALGALRRFSGNGSYWWDKWHTSPYYVNSAAVSVLHGLDNNLAASRLRWILSTQHADGGWGYFGYSTAEETAYCLEALLYWNQYVSSLDPGQMASAAQYLRLHYGDTRYPPLWIGKSLYTPHNVVRAAVLGALHSYAALVT